MDSKCKVQNNCLVTMIFKPSISVFSLRYFVPFLTQLLILKKFKPIEKGEDIMNILILLS